MTAQTKGWEEANQTRLTAGLAVVHDRIARLLSLPAESTPVAVSEPVSSQNPAAIDALCDTFGLSTFERGVLLMCAGVELDSRFSELYRAASKDARSPLPIFSLALAALEGAHWSALLPGRPLRFWHLIEVLPGDVLTACPLKIDERILHYLAGTYSLDERVRSLTDSVATATKLPETHDTLALQVAKAWTNGGENILAPVIQLCGAETFAKRAIGAAACALSGMQIRLLQAALVPRAVPELDLFVRLWEREVALHPACLLIEYDDLESSDAQGEAAVNRLLGKLRGPVLLSVRERRKPIERLVLSFDVDRPTAVEQSKIWRQALGPAAATLNGSVDGLVAQFNLDPASIEAAVAETMREDVAAMSVDELSAELWDACRRQSRPRLEGLAQRLDPAAGWDQLILPERQKHLLAQIAVQVRHRMQVYKGWGFASKGGSGLGISALFAGPSGTGKTMAGEVLANELKLDICRIDLSQVISKYIGETEKNLRRVFDAAEDGASILLFDEADALFGKRSEVKDSHDRYANIEVSYLLQRMEQYRGLAILTTNRRDAIDTAFLRRIRFVIEFPFPEAMQRAEMWARAFPPTAPTEDLRIDKLARLNAAGGNIRNIALGAAFLAAHAKEPIRMNHVLVAARSEFAKVERPLSDAETAGWST